MKTQIILHMQKGQKLATKLIILFLILSVNCCIAQKNKDNYYFLAKMIQLTKQTNDSVYQLSRRNETGSLKNYYDFRFNNRPFYTTFTYDTITGKEGIDTLELEQNLVKWKAKYRILDSAFTREDIDNVIARKRDTTKWDSTNSIFSNKKLSLIKWTNSYNAKNFISKPYYNENKTHVFIVSSHTINRRRTARIYVFKKEDEEWVVIDTVKNVGW